MKLNHFKNYTKISFLSLATLTAASSWAAADTKATIQVSTLQNEKHHEVQLNKIASPFQVAALKEANSEDEHGHEENERDHDEAEEDDHENEAGKEAVKDEHGHEEAEGNDHGNGNEDEEEGEGLKISAEGQKIAGIHVEALTKSSVPSLLNAPGEIMANNYLSSVVTPRISAIVQQRHAYLGEQITKGTSLATMFSVEMAEAQGDHLLATQEWLRVKKLGKNTVSSKRYTETFLAFQQSKARLQTYGMSEEQIIAFTKAGKSSNLGYFDLVAVSGGMIVKDDFRLGEVIEPGRNIFEVVDERTVWVDAKISISESERVKSGVKAIVRAGKLVRNGTVQQIYRQMDETTRTIGLRIELDNLDRAFKPGQFVGVDLVIDPVPVTSVPTEAVFQTEDGDWAVFIETANGTFEEKEVETVRSTVDRIIIEGLPIGTRVVTQGTFFVKSEAAKGNFQVHNH